MIKMPRVHKDESGRVIDVQMDEKITKDHPLAVQIPPEADGSRQHPLDALLEPSPNDVFGDTARAAEAAEVAEEEAEAASA